MRKLTKVMVMLTISILLTIGTVTTAYAGQWQDNETGRWWLEDDGTYPAGAWQWLDTDGDGVSECYYFNEEGYLVMNTIVDGYAVDANGAWLQDGVVQTRQETAVTSAESTGLVLNTDLIKSKYADLLGKDMEYVAARFDCEPESILETTIEYTGNGWVTVTTDSDGKIDYVIAYTNQTLLLDVPQESYKIAEISNLLGTEVRAWEAEDGQVFCWEVGTLDGDRTVAYFIYFSNLNEVLNFCALGLL